MLFFMESKFFNRIFYHFNTLPSGSVVRRYFTAAMGDASSNALQQPGNTALTGRLIGIYLVENDPEI